ncbi:DUF1353 domain-containing protein [Haloferula sp. BvORR071]|uniref:DUF1353 domain-containing protein n=1 Tax=Haloferula sp. BvORR071 TaxID=1396141 RepID=UPI00054D86FE|nr:DUF1353 domain-containing protein [Haloferula sp. BvORR071]
MRGRSRLFRLVEPFVFVSSKGRLTAPAGFVTDGYSIPSAAWSWCNPFEEGMESSILHDLNYSAACPYGFTRKEADDLLLEGMAACGVPWLKRQTIYRAVRLFGWRYYKPLN